jgi:hypothetical protein
MRFHTFCFISAAPTAAVRRKQQQALSCFRACATTTKQWFSLLSLSLFIKVARRQRERVFPRFFFFVCFSRVKGTQQDSTHTKRKKEKSSPHKKKIHQRESKHGGKNRTHDHQNADGNHRSEQRGRAERVAKVRRRRGLGRVRVDEQCVFTRK